MNFLCVAISLTTPSRSTAGGPGLEQLLLRASVESYDMEGFVHACRMTCINQAIKSGIAISLGRVCTSWWKDRSDPAHFFKLSRASTV